MKHRDNKPNDNWGTPKEFYDKLNQQYNFDFDPCPMHAQFDGLAMDWGERNYVNPPYSRPLKDMFVRKALEEANKGKLCVLLLPVSTSTKLFHDVILPNAKSIEFIKGRLRFLYNGTEDRGCGQHDSMLVVFDGRVFVSQLKCERTYKNSQRVLTT